MPDMDPDGDRTEGMLRPYNVRHGLIAYGNPGRPFLARR